MKHLVVFYSSRIRKAANSFLVEELNKAGLTGIVPSHGDIIALMLREGRMKMSDLAKKVDRTKATTTVLIDKLEKLGIVKRVKDESDSRITYIELTNKGKSYQDVFESISAKLNEKVYKGFTESEAELLESMLQKVRQNLK